MTSELVSQRDCPLTVYKDRGVWSFDEKSFPSELSENFLHASSCFGEERKSLMRETVVILC